MTISDNIENNQLTSDEKERYLRHLTLKEIGNKGQLKLKNSSVLCIGAGGLGSSVLFYIAAAGIGKIGIIDDDKVEKSNLQRQIIHETNSIGHLKVDSAKDRIQRLNPNCEVYTFQERINPKNILRIIQQFDIVCDCSDNFSTRYLINDACIILNKPLVFGSVQGFEGQISVFNLKNNSPNLRDLLPENPSRDDIPSCSEFGVMGVSTGLIGVLQVNEIIKIITGIGEILDGIILIFDLLNMNSKKLNLKADKTNKNIKDLSQFKSDYEEIKCIKKIELDTIDVSQFNHFYRNNFEEILLIDVRDKEEFNISSIKGSISIPLKNLKEKSKLKFIRNESISKEIFTLCQVGIRSKKACEILNKYNVKAKSIVGGVEKLKYFLSLTVKKT